MKHKLIYEFLAGCLASISKAHNLEFRTLYDFFYKLAYKKLNQHIEYKMFIATMQEHVGNESPCFSSLIWIINKW